MDLWSSVCFVQPALAFAGILPSSGARILAGQDSGRAMGAPDARIIAVVQTVIGDFVKPDIGPDVFACPARQRIHFDELEPTIPFDQPGVRPGRRLITANTCDPRGVVFEDTSQWFDFAKITATVGIASPQGFAVLNGLLLGSEQRLDLQKLGRLQTVPVNESSFHVVGFGK